MANENMQLQVTEKTVLPYIQPRMQDFIDLIGEKNFKRETSFAIQAVNSNTYLATATPQSVAKAIWNVAITGLSLNPVLKLAYITPRKVNGVLEALLMPSYQGMTKLITDTGSVKQIVAHVVYRNDTFEVEYGTDIKLIHKPKFGKHTNEDVTHAYAIATLQDGSKQFEVMDIEEIYSIRARSDGYRAFKSGKASTAIWESDFGEMCRKTVIKRLCKYLPKSVINEKWEKVMQAVDIDNSEYAASEQQLVFIENLVGTCTLEESHKAYIMSKVESGMSKGEAEKFIEDLQLNQLAKRDMPNMSATDAKDAVKVAIGGNEAGKS